MSVEPRLRVVPPRRVVALQVEIAYFEVTPEPTNAKEDSLWGRRITRTAHSVLVSVSVVRDTVDAPHDG